MALAIPGPSASAPAARSRFRRRAAVAAAGALSLAIAAALLYGLAPTTARRPHVILIVWDTTRADRLSAYGHARRTTPWLEEFASGATLFRNAFTPSPWSPAAHASLFTGNIPRNHGLLLGSGDRVAPEIPLLAESLRDGGYETVGFTANAWISPVTGLSAGFERFVPLHQPDGEFGAVDRAIESVRSWLLERRNSPAEGPRRPLFLFVNLMDAHLPWNPEPRDLSAVHGERAAAPGLRRVLGLGEKDAMAHTLGIRTLDAEALEGAGMAYDAALHRLDRGTGALLGLLREDGLLEGSLVAIVSDHGEHLGEHGRLSHQMSLHDEVLRIPMVVRWPGVPGEGRVEEAQVRLQDLHRTILDAASVPCAPAAGRDSRSLAGRPLAGRPLVAAYYRPSVWLESAMGFYPDAPAKAFRPFHVGLLAHQDPVGAPGARKLVRASYLAPGDAAAVDEDALFDPAADPDEARDLLRDGPPAERAAAERLAAGL